MMEMKLIMALKKDLTGDSTSHKCVDCKETVYCIDDWSDKDVDFICRECFIDRLINDELGDDMEFKILERNIDSVRDYLDRDVSEEEVVENFSEGMRKDILKKILMNDRSELKKTTNNVAG